MSQSLSRALQILIELGEGERSLDQVAARLGVHKTTAMRLLHTLEADRFVRRDDRQRYHLGSRLFALGRCPEYLIGKPAVIGILTTIPRFKIIFQISAINYNW